MTREELEKRYETYEDKVQEYMKMVGEAIFMKYQEIPDIFIISLDALAGNSEIMTKAMKNITSGDEGIIGSDKYRGEKKSTSLTAFFAAQGYALKILNTYGLTPLGKSKIRENTDAQDVAKYLEQLTS